MTAGVRPTARTRPGSHHGPRSAATPRTRTATWQDPHATAARLDSMSGIDAVQAFMAGELAPPPIAEVLGITLVDAAHGWCTFRMPVGEHLYNPMATVHGGVYGVLLDSAMACAVHTTLPAGTGYTTVDYSVQLVRPITTAVDVVLGHGEVVHGGRRVVTAQGRIVDGDGRLYGTATTTCLVLPRS